MSRVCAWGMPSEGRSLTPAIEKLTLLQAAKILHPYLERSDEIQAGIRNMLQILNDPTTDEDDRDMTLFTLADALFRDPRERISPFSPSHQK